MAINHENHGFLSHGLWACQVVHQRHTPKPHNFSNRLFWFGLELTQLSSLPRWFGLFSCETPALIQYRDADFFPSSHQGMASDRVIEYLEQQDATVPPDSRVMLLGQLRTGGYLFNPIALYVILSPQGEPLCAVAEVTNTFYERKAFLIQRTQWNPETKEATFESSMPKNFYVSPFLDLTLNFQFLITLTPQAIALTVNSLNAAQQAQIHTQLTGCFIPLTLSSLVMQLLYFPLLPLQIITAIHWQAFRLWLKKIPYHNKEENPQWQTDLLVR